MKILVDECIPRKFKDCFPGHECRTVPEAGLAGKKNGELLSIAERQRTSTLVFRGCAAHMCPLVFGIALFRLDDGKPFVVKVSRLCKENDVEYSPNLLQPEYKSFKDWLDEQIKDNALPD